MRFETYGNISGQPVVLLHGMATTGHICFDNIIPLLNDYCVILGEVDGHYENSEFKSLNDCCEQIEEYVNINCSGRLYGLLGFSMGGSISVRLMDRGKIQIENVILDDPFCVKMGLLTPVFREMFAWAIGRIGKGKSIPMFLAEKIMGKGNSSIIDMFYKGMTVSTTRNVCNDVYRFEISDNLMNFKGNVFCWYGSNEPFPKKSLKRLKSYLPGIVGNEYENMGHGQFLNEHPNEYAQDILKTYRKR